MIKRLNAFFLSSILAFLFAQCSIAQSPEDHRYIVESLENNTGHDISSTNYRITDAYTDPSTGFRHIYFVQSENGIEVEGSESSIHISGAGEILHSNITYQKDLIAGLDEKSRISATPSNAIQKSVKLLGWNERKSINSNRPTNHLSWTFELDAQTCHADLIWSQGKNGKFEPNWRIVLISNDGYWWQIRLSEPELEIIHKTKLDYSCNPLSLHYPKKSSLPYIQRNAFLSGSSGTYNVFELPAENPIVSGRSLVTDPHDPIASPFGWHDIDGEPGPDFTTTRGNNADVFPDRDGNLNPDFMVDGGAELIFDEPVNLELEASNNLRAAVVNTYYIVNKTHDILYHLGFNEASGNFQENNYGNGGQSGDEMNVYVQYRADDPYGIDPPAINNANYSGGADGGSARIRLYIWDAANQSLFEVMSPPEIAGRYQTGIAFFGPSVAEQPVTGQLVLADDGVGFTADACQLLQNGPDLDGNIAVIDRGDCRFAEKIIAAQEEGALGVIICNNRPGLATNMVDEILGDQVEIPSAMIPQEDCIRIKSFIEQGVTASISQPVLNGPDTLDAAFDNGLIIHEYIHGLTNRLTGGPSRVGCLNNVNYGALEEGEQMGEGWSDFFGLVLTQQPNYTEETARGFGAYLTGANNIRDGIRPFPFSTEMTVNPVTYADIFDASVPHGVGHVWASMLWDLYWKFIDTYGFDPDLISGNGGNRDMLRITVEALKLQPCDPGFVEGRDAILAADELLFNGANECLIWEVFARRGLGFGADQGSNFRRRDGIESFTIPPACLNSYTITKRMTPLIEAGDTIEVELRIGNYSNGTSDELRIIDEIPVGCTVIESSLPNGATTDPANAQIYIPLQNLLPGFETVFTYQMVSASDQASRPMFEDDLEGDEVMLDWEVETFQGSVPFELQENAGIDNSIGWTIANTDNVNIHNLNLRREILLDANQPVLRFFQRYNTETGSDGGVVEISDDGGQTWNDLGPFLFRHPYPRSISLNTFNELDRRAFSGDQNSWIATYADLSNWRGQTVSIRWRFGSDFQFDGMGWWLDEFAVFDAFNYQSTSGLYEDELLLASTVAEEWGTIVQPDQSIPTAEPEYSEPELLVYPNPVSNVLTLLSSDGIIGHIRIYQIDGSMVRKLDTEYGQKLNINVSDLSTGVYFIEVQIGNYIQRKKFVKS